MDCATTVDRSTITEAGLISHITAGIWVSRRTVRDIPRLPPSGSANVLARETWSSSAKRRPPGEE